MKPILRYTLLALGLVTVAALPAQAVTSFSETFSAASLNANRWSLTKEGTALFAPAAAKLNFSVSNAKSESLSYITLNGIRPKFNESWEVTVDAVNANLRPRGSGSWWTGIGVWVFNAADMDDAIGLELSGGDQTEIYCYSGTNGVEAADVKKKISSTKASLRVTFSKVTKVITLWYRTSPSAAWTKHATFSTTNSANAMRRGNWRMNETTGKFGIALYGFGDRGAVIPLGRMSLDNFVIRNR